VCKGSADVRAAVPTWSPACFTTYHPGNPLTNGSFDDYEEGKQRRWSNLKNLLFFGFTHPLGVTDVPFGQFVHLVLGPAFIVLTD
jgi:hypothetical protein